MMIHVCAKLKKNSCARLLRKSGTNGRMGLNFKVQSLLRRWTNNEFLIYKSLNRTRTKNTVRLQESGTDSRNRVCKLSHLHKKFEVYFIQL